MINNFDDSTKWFQLVTFEIGKQPVTTELFFAPFSHVAVRALSSPKVTWRKAGYLSQVSNLPVNAEHGYHYIPYETPVICALADIGQCRLRFTPVRWNIKITLTLWAFYGAFVESGQPVNSPFTFN